MVTVRDIKRCIARSNSGKIITNAEAAKQVALKCSYLYSKLYQVTRIFPTVKFPNIRAFFINIFLHKF